MSEARKDTCAPAPGNKENTSAYPPGSPHPSPTSISREGNTTGARMNFTNTHHFFAPGEFVVRAP